MRREIVSYPEANNRKSADRRKRGSRFFFIFYFVSFPEAIPVKNTYLPTVHQRD